MTDQMRPTGGGSGFPGRPLALIVTVVSFALGVLGFFLSWGTYSSSSRVPGTDVVASFQESYTGATAGWYGYATLGIAAVGLLVALWWWLRGSYPGAKFHVAMLASLGVLLLTVVVRNDPNVKVFGTVSYALSVGDYTLGYTMGPGLALLGFLAAAIAAIFLPGTGAKPESPREQDSPTDANASP